MIKDKNDSVALKRSMPKKGLGQWIFIVLVIIGLLSLAYYFFDLVFPNHFVGDMYGLEVMCRLFFIILASIPIIIGIILLGTSQKKDKKAYGFVGTALIMFSCIVYLALGITTAYSRWRSKVRDSYPRRSVEDLLYLAREKKDQFAIDALLIKKDADAVPGLCAILLDENEQGRLRVCAAHALGEIGGDRARGALQEVLSRNPPEFLKIAAEYALKTRMGIPAPVVGEEPTTKSQSRTKDEQVEVTHQ